LRIAEEPPPVPAVPPPAPVSTAPPPVPIPVAPPPAPVSAAPPSVPVPVAPPPVPVSAAPPPVSVAPLPASVPTASEMTALQEPEAREPESPKPVSTEIPRPASAEIPKPASAEIPKPVPAEIKDVQSPIPEPPAPPASPPPAIKPPVGVASARDGRYTVQVGAFRSPDNARSLSQRLISAGFPANVASVPSRKGGTLHRVYIGRFVNHAKADPVQAAVRARGFDAIVVTLD
ncbi:MAG: SPOR domain-containing protein, partial [Alphaproteobacteria bacterium]|nr:SPOR domain-containing protein [Alphaproteobacteria bacterium]